MSYRNYNWAPIMQRGPADLQFRSTHKDSCANVSGGAAADAVNRPVAISPLVTGAVAKIPVVLAELTVQINVNTIVSLPEPALEIKDIKKHLKITQCLLIQDTNVLFIKGFIRKNIQYATRKCSNKDGVCGDIKHCTIDAPFTTTTPITYNGIAPLPPIPSESTEFRYFRKQDVVGPDFADKDRLLSSDLSEFNQISTEFFNELPFCELISARIVEFDEFLNPTRPHKVDLPFEEREFTKIEEKAVIFLTLKILQKRQVAVGPISPIPKPPC
ncbi:hypothetical protein SAMN02745975_03114 [Geosporobacter subterraneus DSM 17957]|uniref:SipL SPOCS domain-containing protein n=1 Tax=Geosporobacter subterraneus DSM 17957 TaxID=1121919 RepID=A0A1M6MWE1_9FIRM|nr:hypothetical protein [Geosporobacter subterraneus]SHJ87752.1 hypothetical protein SAMN02745975_03114 [Geosporobacter subterraneus DSM 17957]